jgi:hypothetical protein
MVEPGERLFVGIAFFSIDVLVWAASLLWHRRGSGKQTAK